MISDILFAKDQFVALFKSLGAGLSPLPGNRFDFANGERALKGYYNMLSLDGLGAFNRAELSAAGALIAYLELTQKGARVALQHVARVSPAHFMGIDVATRRNLELTQTLSGQRSGCCLPIDRSVTAAGARLLAARLAAPLTDVKLIDARHDAVRRSSRIRSCVEARAKLCALPPISRGRWAGFRWRVGDLAIWQACAMGDGRASIVRPLVQGRVGR